MHSSPPSRSGFTIVELLIVIVVIGILAAITIVAFNGVQNKAKSSAAQSAVTQANKKIISYAAENSDSYPATLAQAGITNTGGLEYSVDNDASPRSYGLTATIGAFSFFVSNTVTQPTAGGYAGHGQGEAVAVTNLATNPSVETTIGRWTTNNSYNSPTIVRMTDGGYAGSSYARVTFGTINNGSLGNIWLNNSPVQSSSTYTASMYVRPTKTKTFAIQIFFIDSGGTSVSSLSGPTTSLVANQWQRISHTFQTPANIVSIWTIATSSGATPWATGDTLDADAAMVTQGSRLYTYADGTSANWIWSGSTHNSTSTGPGL